VRGRTWKLIGLAGVAGVAATGVVLARDERRRRAYTPDEIRSRLHERHAAALAGPAGAESRGAGPADGGSTRDATTPAPRVRLPDPVAIARYETDAWVGYYLRNWRRVLRGVVGMVKEGFDTRGSATLRGAWWVLRANQVWAPYPDNDPDAARRYMARFYAIAARAQGWSIDPEEAARLEVAWWQVHREVQRIDPSEDDERLVAALTELYRYVYGRPAEQLRPAAVHRAAAMRLSDAWVRSGCRPDDDRLVAEEASLVWSYTALRDALADGSVD
jgi:hypothetical protein